VGAATEKPAEVLTRLPKKESLTRGHAGGVWVLETMDPSWRDCGVIKARLRLLEMSVPLRATSSMLTGVGSMSIKRLKTG